MSRFALLILFAVGAHAAEPTVDIETAAKIYQSAAVREQVRASLVAMPEHVRQMFSADTATRLTAEQLQAVTDASKRGFRIDVFEAPALRALADNLDLTTVAKTQAFFDSELGKRMVNADVTLANFGEANIDKVMSGEIAAPTTAKRDVIISKLEKATRSTESTVQIFLSMGQSVAEGTAVGSGMDAAGVSERARKSADQSRAALEDSMRIPMRRFMAYGYRDLSDADLKQVLAFMDSTAGRRFVLAYNASMGAGYDAMGRRTGEQLGESLRELAMAQVSRPQTDATPPGIAAPPPVLPHTTTPPASPQ